MTFVRSPARSLFTALLLHVLLVSPAQANICGWLASKLGHLPSGTSIPTDEELAAATNQSVAEVRGQLSRARSAAELAAVGLGSLCTVASTVLCMMSGGFVGPVHPINNFLYSFTAASWANVIGRHADNPGWARAAMGIGGILGVNLFVEGVLTPNGNGTTRWGNVGAGTAGGVFAAAVDLELDAFLRQRMLQQALNRRPSAPPAAPPAPAPPADTTEERR